MADAPEPTPDDLDPRALHARLAAIQTRLTLVEAEVGPGPFVSGRVPSVADFLSEHRGSPAYIVDEERARDTPCIEVEASERRRLLFSPGAVGPLDEEQQALYCPSVEKHQLTPAQRERMEALAAASTTCKAQVADVPKGEKLEPFLQCVHSELKERGHPL